MKIQLPNGEKVNLEEDMELQNKIEKVSELILEWSDLIEQNWESINIRFFLDGLANYLVWHKEVEDKGKEDKDVLSIRKIEEMTGIRRGKGVPFTSLSKSQKEEMGL